LDLVREPKGQKPSVDLPSIQRLASGGKPPLSEREHAAALHRGALRRPGFALPAMIVLVLKVEGILDLVEEPKGRCVVDGGAHWGFVIRLRRWVSDLMNSTSRNGSAEIRWNRTFPRTSIRNVACKG
jgi:hypothetical protein